MQESKSSQVEVFLNSVPILASLSREEKLKLANALEEQNFEPNENIVEEACFYLQKDLSHLLPLQSESKTLMPESQTSNQSINIDFHEKVSYSSQKSSNCL